MKQVLAAILAFVLAWQPVTVYAEVLPVTDALPQPGTMVAPSPAFSPVLMRGLVIHPENPLQFDFIVDSGDEKLQNDALETESQRMVNYFLASLTIPQQDLWVNLSPVEKDRIIPDALIKTELGRDLLAQDYLLKQLTASLIYPENDLGRTFWQRVYDEAYQKFGATDIPVDTFNKVWIVPEKATVFERGNAVYITQAHLKVMLEADYEALRRSAEPREADANFAPQNESVLAERGLASNSTYAPATTATQELSKQILREVVVPAIEKEVNEGRNFAKLRQVVYAMVLAQWYQDVLKESVLNKAYSGKNKVAGIDLSDPKNKELIYERYMVAYKKGVFNYIKEETDRLTHEAVPKKYFSGGFDAVQRVVREKSDLAMSNGKRGKNNRVGVAFSTATVPVQSHATWSAPDLPIVLLEELRSNWKDGEFNHPGLLKFIEKYSPQVDNEEKLYPVEAVWPVLKAFALLTKTQKQEMVQALQDEYQGRPMSFLVEGILLINKIYSADWAKQRTPHLANRQMYLVAAEIHHWAGGLGPVMKFLGKLMKELGLNVAYIAPWYQHMRENRKTIELNYEKDTKVKIVDDKFDEFEVDIGDRNGEKIIRVKVRVAKGIDENGVTVYMPRDVQPDGSSYYTYMLYNYDQEYNHYITKEETMAFINVATAKLLLRLEEKRKREQPDAEPAVVHSNDGQLAPLQAVTMSWYGRRKVIKDIVWAFTTHTYLNRGNNDDVWWGIERFLKHMMGITGRYVNAFRQYSRFGPKDGSLRQGAEFIDHTSGGIKLAAVVLAVAAQHRDRVARNDQGKLIRAATNGSAPEEMAIFLRAELERIGADLEDPTAEQIARAKKVSKNNLNAAKIIRHNGKILHIDEDAVLLESVRRGVDEKAGMGDAYTRRNIFRLVQGILDRKHLEITFESLSKKMKTPFDGGAIFDWLLKKGYLKTVALKPEGRYFDTDTGYSITEGRLQPVNMEGLKKDLTEEYPEQAQQIFEVLKKVLNRRKANVTPFFNDQGRGSVNVLGHFAPLEIEIENAKAESPDQFPGDFQFVSSFLPDVKKQELAAADADIKSSWLGANEVTEEDTAANGGIQIGTEEGEIIGQGMRLSEGHPGNVLPAVTEDDYWEAYLTILEMTPEELAENQRISYQLGRTVMLAVRTSSVNALAYEKVIARREIEDREDAHSRALIIEDLNGNNELVKSILGQGNGVKESFVFLVRDRGRFPADETNLLNGLRSFIEKKKALEELYGYDAFLSHFLNEVFLKADFQKYLLELFRGLESGDVLRNWLVALELSPGTFLEKYKRFGRFLEDLEIAIEDRLTVISVNQDMAKFLLNDAGSPDLLFIWRSSMENEVDRNGPGLQALVEAFSRLQEQDREDVLRFHSMGETSHILGYLNSLLKIDPLMAPLQYKIEKRLNLFRQIPRNQVEQKIDLTFEVMDLVRHYVELLNQIAFPERAGSDASKSDPAQNATGGIDVRNIGVDRQGQLTTGVLNDQALEDMLTNALGLRGVIIGITPINDLKAMLEPAK